MSKHNKKTVIAMLTGIALCPLIAEAAILHSNIAGQYVGISEVLINGDLWDAEFTDGSFDDAGRPVYGQEFALDASTALKFLLDGQFNGTVFDTTPSSTLGCEVSNFRSCYMATAYAYNPIEHAFSSHFTVNRDLARATTLGNFTLTESQIPLMHFSPIRWTESPSAVPAPATVWLISSGLFGVMSGSLVRRKLKSARKPA